MGGCCCCCAARGVELNSSPPFYLYPVSEEREPLSSHSHHVTPSTLSTGLLVDTNLDTSSPDTYRAPPTPLPYDSNLGRPQTPPGNRVNKGESAVIIPNAEPVEGTNTSNVDETSAKGLKESEGKVETDIELAVSKDVEDEKSDDLKKSTEPMVLPLEEDVCPTCLEEYDKENPKIITKCEHHFHLACILEWMERSDTCPVCDQEMIFDASIDS